jgi:hypothetical protein
MWFHAEIVRPVSGRTGRIRLPAKIRNIYGIAFSAMLNPVGVRAQSVPYSQGALRDPGLCCRTPLGLVGNRYFHEIFG